MSIGKDRVQQPPCAWRDPFAHAPAKPVQTPLRVDRPATRWQDFDLAPWPAWPAWPKRRQGRIDNGPTPRPNDSGSK